MDDAQNECFAPSTPIIVYGSDFVDLALGWRMFFTPHGANVRVRLRIFFMEEAPATVADWPPARFAAREIVELPGGDAHEAVGVPLSTRSWSGHLNEIG